MFNVEQCVVLELPGIHFLFIAECIIVVRVCLSDLKAKYKMLKASEASEKSHIADIIKAERCETVRAADSQLYVLKYMSRDGIYKQIVKLLEYKITSLYFTHGCVKVSYYQSVVKVFLLNSCQRFYDQGGEGGGADGHLFLLQACGSIMWRKASAAALLALAMGYFYHGSPSLPENILQYISVPNFQLSFQNHNGQNRAEWIISAAWDTLITLPSRQWSRVAVG